MRQIDYLSPDFDLTVIGPRPPVSGWENVTFQSLPGPTLASKLSHAVFYLLGRFAPSCTTGVLEHPPLPGGVQTSIGGGLMRSTPTTGKRYPSQSK